MAISVENGQMMHRCLVFRPFEAMDFFGLHVKCEKTRDIASCLSYPTSIVSDDASPELWTETYVFAAIGTAWMVTIKQHQHVHVL